MKFKAYLLLLFIPLIMTACSKESSQDLCRETDRLLKESKGEGLNRVAMIGCVNGGPEKARKRLDALKKELGQ